MLKIQLFIREKITMNSSSEPNNQKDEKALGHYIALGIALGAGIGTALGTSVGVVFDMLALGIGVGIGLGAALGVSLGIIIFQIKQNKNRVAEKSI